MAPDKISILKPGAIKSLCALLDDLKDPKIFLVRGKNSYYASGAAKNISFIFTKFHVTEFHSFSTNPKMEEAAAGYELFRNSNSNIILAVGGGSVIDMAKIIKHLSITARDPKTPEGFIAIPTTAGSGSESTSFAVVYRGGIKESIDQTYLLPDAALVDPDLLQGQNKYQMAVSGIDAFSQAVESSWSIKSNDESQIYAERAIKLMWENLEKAINGDSDARIKISEASHFSGKAINLTRTTAPHALSYAFTSKFNLAHGHSVALFLPFFIYHHKYLKDNDCMHPKGKDFVKERIKQLASTIHADMQNIEYAVTGFFKRCGVNICFPEIGIPEFEFMELFGLINAERLNNNPGRLNKSLYRRIYNFNQELCSS